jgi:chromate transporter
MPQGEPTPPTPSSLTPSGPVSQLRITPLRLFLTFTQITLSGFGGTGFWTRLVLVERRQWLSHREYVDCMSIAQLLPGPNVFNLSVIVGHRLGGYAGALAAISGLVVWPFFMMIGVGLLYGRYGELPLVQRALAGISAVAVGLVFANAIKLASVLPRHWRPWLIVALAFVGIGVMRLPLIGVAAVLAPFGIALAWREKH